MEPKRPAKGLMTGEGATGQGPARQPFESGMASVRLGRQEGKAQPCHQLGGLVDLKTGVGQSGGVRGSHEGPGHSREHIGAEL
jgi:hypothetical protein